MKTKKMFDCVEMKRDGAQEVQQVLAGMTLQEELAYWQNGTDELTDRQRQLHDFGEIETMPLPPSAGPECAELMRLQWREETME